RSIIFNPLHLCTVGYLSQVVSNIERGKVIGENLRKIDATKQWGIKYCNVSAFLPPKMIGEFRR
ncbi:MAG: hypothetical protein OEZ40_07225, partial [Candidatus Bathyarchaeota archaeon]|nr:hypothetical protein [Candidatus Bathyarchaeota archaeon]